MTVAQFSRLIGVDRRKVLKHLNKDKTPAQIAQMYGHYVGLPIAA